MTVNGVCINYAVAGEGKPVILVHGNGESHKALSMQAEQLVNAGYKVYAPDSRGHGANEPLKEYHYIDMAEDIFQFIRKVGLDKPAFYGHSDGGIIGLLLEINHPGTLGVMAISGTNLSPKGLSADFIKECANEASDPLTEMMLNEPNIAPQQLENIKIPVLVTAGEYDLILREETDRIAEHLPYAKKIIVEGKNHGNYIIDSSIMGELLLDFLSENY
ncbi:MAG: alpha/beta hydrolase [Firmicutes bacterium]|nr:alpha/beta hydrolase [Bacillota bacterium]